MTKKDTIGLQLYSLCNQKGLDVYKEFGTNFPSQALLQKWFRDEHKVFINIDAYGPHSDFKGSPRFMVNTYFNNKEGYLLFISGRRCNLINFKTYEEALEEGLIQAFGLI